MCMRVCLNTAYGRLCCSTCSGVQTLQAPVARQHPPQSATQAAPSSHDAPARSQASVQQQMVSTTAAMTTTTVTSRGPALRVGPRGQPQAPAAATAAPGQGRTPVRTLLGAHHPLSPTHASPLRSCRERVQEEDEEEEVVSEGGGRQLARLLLLTLSRTARVGGGGNAEWSTAN